MGPDSVDTDEMFVFITLFVILFSIFWLTSQCKTVLFINPGMKDLTIILEIKILLFSLYVRKIIHPQKPEKKCTAEMIRTIGDLKICELQRGRPSVQSDLCRCCWLKKATGSRQRSDCTYEMGWSGLLFITYSQTSIFTCSILTKKKRSII